MTDNVEAKRSNSVLIVVVAVLIAAVALLAIVAFSIPQQTGPALQVDTENAKVSIGKGGISVSIAPSAPEPSP